MLGAGVSSWTPVTQGLRFPASPPSDHAAYQEHVALRSPTIVRERGGKRTAGSAAVSLVAAVAFIAMAVALGLRPERAVGLEMPVWPLRGALSPTYTDAPGAPEAPEADAEARREALPAGRKHV